RPESPLYIEAFERIIKNVEFGHLHVIVNSANSYHSNFTKNLAAITAETLMCEDCGDHIEEKDFIDEDSLITSCETIEKLRTITGMRDENRREFCFRISQEVAGDILCGSMGVDFEHLLETRDIVRTNEDVKLYGEVTSSEGTLCARTEHYPRGICIDWTFD
ncbi:hypothetical protein PFISCL1PPCAC_20921, partial [Pristionchus fissidentatus]